MTYPETLDYLYARLPMYQRVGAVAHTRSLANIEVLCARLAHPERGFRAVHVAGTNGKGSSSHMLAAVCQAAGYRTGLYTSPHLIDFTERIRLNGEPIPPEEVVRFVETHRDLLEELQPSFFEMTVALAFRYFADQRVDIAIIEVGLGGRLDSTNVIRPLVSLITNISWDHQDLLGDTLPLIAAEKAGIIKPGVPVVISQVQTEVAAVFQQVAAANRAPIRFADTELYVATQTPLPEGVGQSMDVMHRDALEQWTPYLPNLHLDLLGEYQYLNVPGVLATLEELQVQGFRFTQPMVRAGLSEVQRRTGLRGRWQVLGRDPLVVADTGHNEAGLGAAIAQLLRTPHQKLHIVFGVVRDKDIGVLLRLLPPEATYYFCEAKIPRALPAPELREQAEAFGLKGKLYVSVAKAVDAARAAAAPEDVVYIGGSTFVVAEAV